MTQEEKQLLLKDLCARLPYGFVIHRYSDNRDIEFGSNEIDDFAHFVEYSDGEVFKPYLRPMSSMTVEEKQYLNDLATDMGIAWFDAKTNDEKWLATVTNNVKSTDYLYSKHLDIHNLISIGLAIEAPEDMYKTESL